MPDKICRPEISNTKSLHKNQHRKNGVLFHGGVLVYLCAFNVCSWLICEQGESKRVPKTYLESFPLCPLLNEPHHVVFQHTRIPRQCYCLAGKHLNIAGTCRKHSQYRISPAISLGTDPLTLALVRLCSRYLKQPRRLTADIMRSLS